MIAPESAKPGTPTVRKATELTSRRYCNARRNHIEENR